MILLFPLRKVFMPDLTTGDDIFMQSNSVSIHDIIAVTSYENIHKGAEFGDGW